MLGSEIICGDSREVLPDFDDNSIDCIVTDPPFGQNKFVGDVWDDNIIRWIDTEGRRLVKDTGSIYIILGQDCTTRAIPLLPDYRILIWAKTTGLLHKNIRDWEYFWQPIFYWRTDNSYFSKPSGIDARDWWDIPTVWAERGEKQHPTQKPIRLLTKILLASCPPQGTVLDPFCGGGTTGVAAVKLGMNYILIDRDKHYFDIARAQVAHAEQKAATERAASTRLMG